MIVYLQHDQQNPRTRVRWSTDTWPAEYGDGLKYHELHVLEGTRPQDVVEAVLMIEDPRSTDHQHNRAVLFLRGVTVDSGECVAA